VRVACLIPARNEARTVRETVLAAKTLPIDEVIVIDDASTDSTADEARAAGADKVIVLDKNLGKGGAMNRGLIETSADVLLLLDADLGASASEASRLLAPILSGDADMSVAILPKGTLTTKPDSSRAPSRKSRKSGFGLAVRIARWGIRRLGKLEVEAPLAGLRAIRRDIVERAGGFEPGWAVEIGLTVAAARLGYRIVEVPAAFRHRVTGRSLAGFLHRGRQFADVARFILRNWRKIPG